MSLHLVTTDSDQQVSVSLDIGKVPFPHEFGGKYVITVQVCPVNDLRDAEVISRQLVDAINSRLGLRLQKQEANR
jgi:hypothetical protein